MRNQFCSLRSLFILLLLSTGIGNAVTAQTIDMGQTNETTGGDGTSASRGDEMTYFIAVTNPTSSNLTMSTVYAKIPLGCTYVAGSTRVNDASVSDVDGKMPFAQSGGLVNSPASSAGILAPNKTAMISYTVAINFAGASLTNSSSFQAVNRSGNTVTVNSNSVSTQVADDIYCHYIFQSTATVATGGQPLYPYRLIQQMFQLNGQGGSPLVSITSPTYNALTGAATTSALTDIEAMAVEPVNGRIYFVNGPTNSPAKELCYYDRTTTGKVYKYVNTPLETNTAAGYNVIAMSYASDGYGYALTANYQDLVRFSVDPSTNIPNIVPLGALIDAGNGSNSITAETGGDLFADAFGRLYLVTNSGKLYRIDPATRNTLYLGTISGVPSAGVNSVAIDYNGYIYISGNYQSVYRVDLSTMTAVAINSGTNNVWKNGDYASCNMPPLGPVLNVTKSYWNTTRNSSYVLTGENVEYTITISNTGTISAGGVKLSDAIPPYAHYAPNSTTINGVPVADIGGTMPFATAGYINSPAAGAGVVLPGDANKVVIKFSVTTDPLKHVCNQAFVTYPEINGTVTINSDDPSQVGGSDLTCFLSDGILCQDCGRIATNNPKANNSSDLQLNEGTLVKVQPNPFVNDLNVQVQLNTAEQVKIRLIDFYGRTVYTATQNVSAGYNSLHINTPASLASGVYVLELSAGNNRLLQKKLVKQ